MAERPLGAPSGRDDLLAVSLALAIALGTVLVGALAAGGQREAPPVALAPDRDPTCAEWTDGCVVCRRTAGGRACSTPGIACIRGPLVCLLP